MNLPSTSKTATWKDVINVLRDKPIESGDVYSKYDLLSKINTSNRSDIDKLKYNASGYSDNEIYQLFIKILSECNIAQLNHLSSQNSRTFLLIIRGELKNSYENDQKSDPKLSVILKKVELMEKMIAGIFDKINVLAEPVDEWIKKREDESKVLDLVSNINEEGEL